MTRLEDDFSTILDLAQEEHGYCHSDEYNEIWSRLDDILLVLDRYDVTDYKDLENKLRKETKNEKNV